MPEDPSRPPEPEAVIAYCKDRLARFKVPATVLFTRASDIPMTVTGRVKQFELVARAVRELGGENRRIAQQPSNTTPSLT